MEKICVKVCGIRDLATAEMAVKAGACHLGFIRYAPSPRYISDEVIRRLFPSLMNSSKVMVDVMPDQVRLNEAITLGFDRFQIHFPAATPLAQVEQWSQTIGIERLWLAPKMRSVSDFKLEWLSYAKTFVWDAGHAQAYGGTGQRSDWRGFQVMQVKYPDHEWILAGGLSPENIHEALQETRAQRVDVNSGVESSLGNKSPERIQSFFQKLAQCQP
jgi:phosphoribosylanthranilate isomerase